MTDPFDSLDSIDRRSYLQATGAATLGTVGLAGCVGQAAGRLATRVTDQPADIGDFESLVVTIDGIWLGPEGAESGADDQTEAGEDTDADDGESDDAGDEDEGDGDDGNDADDGDGEADDDEPSGREYYEFEEPQRADLVELQGEETQLVDERDLDVATYRFLQLHVSDVDGTLEGGDEATVDLPGAAPLTFNQEFEIREDTRTSFTADFAPVRRGRTETYVLRPVPQGIAVSYDDVDDE